MTNSADLHEGTPVRMGGRDFIVPALTMGQVKQLKESGKLARIFEVNVLSPQEDIDLALEVIQSAMARNYPEITIKELEDILDAKNTSKVILSIMGMSGLIRTDGDDSGEAQAGT